MSTGGTANHPDHGRLIGATIVTAALEEAAVPYRRDLGYRIAHDGPLPAALAEAWDAPALVGARHVVLQGPGRDESWLRLVEDRDAVPPAPMRSLGWAAIEIAVAAVDGLEAPFSAAPWRVLGKPADLSFTDAIRAMQVAGPSGEVFYLTEIKRQLPGFDLPVATTPVDRIFVMILGCRDADDAGRFYGDLLGCRPATAFPAVIRVVNGAYGLPPDHKTMLGTVTLGGQSLLEFDGFPPEAVVRRPADGRLPGGIAVASMLASSLAGDWRTRATRAVTCDLPPYSGRPALTVRGPAGELVELIALD